MSEVRTPGSRLYRLVVEQGDRTTSVTEFEADGPHGALNAADRLGTAREVTIFEDGRALARVRMTAGGGCWMINPPVLDAAPRPPREEPARPPALS